MVPKGGASKPERNQHAPGKTKTGQTGESFIRQEAAREGQRGGVKEKEAAAVKLGTLPDALPANKAFRLYQVAVPAADDSGACKPV